MFGSTIFGEGPFGGALPPWRRIVEASGALDAVALQEGVGGSIAQGVGAVPGDAKVAGLLAMIVQSSPSLGLQGNITAYTAANEVPSLVVVHPPDLAPLAASHEADDLEAELKALFKQMFDTYIRPDERYVNLLGMPQNGPRALVESSLAADGLAIYRGADVASGAGAYLLRAWRAKNPKRGLHLLQTYLQLLWPNVWTADQMWQDARRDYPKALAAKPTEHHVLTSRIEVTLPARATTGGDAQAIAAGLRASLPARMVMKMSIVDETSFDAGLAIHYYAGALVASFDGNFA